MNDNAELGRSTAAKVTGMTSVQVDAFTGDPFYLPVPIRSLVDESFRGLNRVQQQRAVYAALQGSMDGPQGQLHALALTTKAPD